MGYIRAEEILPVEVIELRSGRSFRCGTGIFTGIILREAGHRSWPVNIFCRRRAYSVS